MNITPEMYSEMSRKAAPKSNTKANTAAAFLTGGGICAFGQVILELFQRAGFDKTAAGAWTAVILVSISAVLTGTGIYQHIANYAGAGTLVPITGFSNAISSSAIEARSEGFILGVGTKIFTIAGSVLLYGSAASLIYGILYYVIS